MTFAQLVSKRPQGVVLSPSQIDLYDRCKRRWALEHIGGLRPPPHPSAQLGTDVHSILERWLKHGTAPDVKSKAGRIAARMIRHLPPPGTVATERRFFFTTRNNLHYTGIIDWSGILDGFAVVGDHKTTGDLQWAKTEAQLHSDVQALIYTVAGCLGFHRDEMLLQWGYGSTKDRDPQTRAVRTKIRLPIAIEKFENVIEPLSVEIVAARTSNADPMSFPPTAAACNDYGGCPHRNICRLTEAERLEGLMTNAPTLATRLAGFPGGGNGFASPAPQNIPPLPGVPLPPGNSAMTTTGFAPPVPPGAPPAPPAPPLGAAVPPPRGGFIPELPTTGFAPPAPPGITFPTQGGPQAGFAPPPPPGAPPAPPAPHAPPAPPQAGFAPFAPPPPPGPPLPPTPPQGQQALPFNPEQAPNPPESALGAAPHTPGANAAEGAPKRGRGRPRKEPGAPADGERAEAMRQAAVGAQRVEIGSGAGRQALFIEGMKAFMTNARWDGTVERLVWAGEMAVAAFEKKFGAAS